MKRILFLSGALALTTAGACKPQLTLGLLQKEAQPAVFGQKTVGDLDADKKDWESKAVDVPSDGELLVDINEPVPITEIKIFGNSATPLGNSTRMTPAETVKAQILVPGRYYVLYRIIKGKAGSSRYETKIRFGPTNPDAKAGVKGNKMTAPEIPADGANMRDKVDYSAQMRTQYYKVKVTDPGDIIVGFIPPAEGGLACEVEGPSGMPTSIPAGSGGSAKASKPGDYFIKVYAQNPGDAGEYTLTTKWKSGDPEAASGDDALQEGATALKLPSDSKSDAVSYETADRTDWFVADIPATQKGKVTLTFKPERGSKIRAEFCQDGEQDGQRIGTGFGADVESGKKYFIKVFAPDERDAGKYGLQFLFTPKSYLACKILEVEKRFGCFVIAGCPRDKPISAGFAATVTVGDQQLGAGVVDSSMGPGVAKVKIFGNDDCRFPADAKVSIEST